MLRAREVVQGITEVTVSRRGNEVERKVDECKKIDPRPQRNARRRSGVLGQTLKSDVGSVKRLHRGLGTQFTQSLCVNILPTENPRVNLRVVPGNERASQS